MIGRVVAAGTSAIIWGDADSEVIIHWAPTDWIRPPKFEARLAHQIARKIGMDSGEGAWEGADSDTSDHEAELRLMVKSANRKLTRIHQESGDRNFRLADDVTVGRGYRLRLALYVNVNTFAGEIRRSHTAGQEGRV
jgi:hypothetical protein